MKNTMGNRDALVSMIPMLLYVVFYAWNALSHAEGNQVSRHYDFYGFLTRGVSMALIVVPVIIFLTWGIGIVLIRLNRS